MPCNLMNFGISRPATNLCLLLALILTTFLLSGTTSTSPGISGLHVVKIVLNSTREAVTSDPLSISGLAEPTLVGPPLTRTSTTPRPTTISLRPTTSAKPTTSTKPLTTASSIKPPSTLGTLSSTPKTKLTAIPTGMVIVRPTNLATAMIKRDEQIDERALEQSSEGTIVLISYFGICTRNRTSPLTCIKSRADPKKLDSSTLEIIRLSTSIQGAISPYPPIIALTVQGIVLLLSFFTTCRSGVTNLTTKLGQTLTLLAFSAFSLSFITAILFQSASSIVYGALSTHPTIVPSKGGSGIALAWAAVLFAGLGAAGVVMLLVTGKAHRQTDGRLGGFGLGTGMFGCRGQLRGREDVEVPPMVIHHSVGGGNRTGTPRMDREERYTRDNYI